VTTSGTHHKESHVTTFSLYISTRSERHYCRMTTWPAMTSSVVSAVLLSLVIIYATGGLAILSSLSEPSGLVCLLVSYSSLPGVEMGCCSYIINQARRRREHLSHTRRLSSCSLLLSSFSSWTIIIIIYLIRSSSTTTKKQNARFIALMTDNFLLTKIILIN
jgi:hypothetical protein